MRETITSKGKTQTNTGKEICNHLSSLEPKKTARPRPTNIWVARPAYFKRSLLLLLCDGMFCSDSGDVNNIRSSHMTLAIKDSGRIYLQFPCIYISFHYAVCFQL